MDALVGKICDPSQKGERDSRALGRNSYAPWAFGHSGFVWGQVMALDPNGKPLVSAHKLWLLGNNESWRESRSLRPGLQPLQILSSEALDPAVGQAD